MLFIFFVVFSKITLCLSGGSLAPVILAVQQGEHVIPTDTLYPDHMGCMTFLAEEAPEPGQYMFIQNNVRLFNFLISSNQPVHMTFHASLHKGRVIDVSVEGSDENNAYLRFYRFLQDRYAHIHRMAEQVKDTQQALLDIEQIEATVREYTEFIAKQHQGTLLSIIAKNVFTPILSKESLPKDYLGYIDFTDPRVLHTAILPLRLREYFTTVLPSDSEILISETEAILTTEMHPDVKSYVARFLFSLFYSSEILGMENVAFHIANNWFLKDSLLCTDHELLTEMETFVRFNKQCLPGMRAPDLILPNAQGLTQNINQYKVPYTVLVFFEDNCPACSSQLLELVRLSEKEGLPEIQFVAVYTGDNKQTVIQYTDFFPKHWVTLWDPHMTSHFHEKFNVTSTPKLYLLNEDKTIIGRDIGTETLEKMIRDQQEKEIVLPNAPNLLLTTENGSSYALYDVRAPYTLLYLYDPSCASCGEVTALLYHLFTTAKESGIMVFAVYTGHDYISWRKWLEEGSYQEWINVWNPSKDSRIYDHFDLNDIPLILLLDKNKGIVANHLSIEDVTFILKELMYSDL